MPVTDSHNPSAAPERTFSVEEAALIICGDNSPASQDWLIQRLRGTRQPRLSGYKVARRWRMTRADLDAAIELLRPNTITPAPGLTSLTTRSRQRMTAVTR